MRKILIFIIWLLWLYLYMHQPGYLYDVRFASDLKSYYEGYFYRYGRYFPSGGLIFLKDINGNVLETWEVEDVQYAIDFPDRLID